MSFLGERQENKVSSSQTEISANTAGDAEVRHYRERQDFTIIIRSNFEIALQMLWCFVIWSVRKFAWWGWNNYYYHLTAVLHMKRNPRHVWVWLSKDVSNVCRLVGDELAEWPKCQWVCSWKWLAPTQVNLWRYDNKQKDREKHCDIKLKGKWVLSQTARWIFTFVPEKIAITLKLQADRPPHHLYTTTPKTTSFQTSI